jgi:Icc-related predicted phosphoesterase
LHGHIHESARLTGNWQERIGKTVAFSAAHDGRELALVRFDPHELDRAIRELIL